MSKILVVEPHRIMQQGIAIALYPENDVQLTTTVPESLPAGAFDAVIVDAASLRENNRLDAVALRRIQSWTLPVVWIGSDGKVRAESKFVVLEPPVGRQALLAAVRECLGLAAGVKANAATEQNKDKKSSAKTPTKENPPGDAPAGEIIELTDIVEE